MPENNKLKNKTLDALDFVIRSTKEFVKGVERKASCDQSLQGVLRYIVHFKNSQMSQQKSL